MSAFIVDLAHIDAIVSYANRELCLYTTYLGEGLPRSDDPEAVGEILLAENVRSVCSRYGESYVVRPYRWRSDRGCTSPVMFLKLLDCLEYQSCECEDFYTTPACKVIEALRRTAIRHLNGYDDAPWGYAGHTPRAAARAGTRLTWGRLRKRKKSYAKRAPMLAPSGTA